MMLGMATGENNNVCVQDFDVDNLTAADGLAVGRASGFVGALMRPFMSGCYSIQDERMYKLLAELADADSILRLFAFSPSISAVAAPYSMST